MNGRGPGGNAQSAPRTVRLPAARMVRMSLNQFYVNEPVYRI